MHKHMRLGALLLAGVLVIPGNLWLTSSVSAQEGSKQLTDEQYEQLKKKRQEQWQTQEDIQKRLEPGTRLQDGVKRSQDAAKRQKAAEQRLKELEK